MPPQPAAAVLLRLANFSGGRRCALEKIGALRQLHLAVSAAGSARLSCPLWGALNQKLLLLTVGWGELFRSINQKVSLGFVD